MSTASNCISITVERLHKFDNDKPLKAFVDISINNVLLVKGLKVLNGKNGLFVAMPQEQGKNNKWYDSVKCLDKNVEHLIAEEVLSVYHAQP